MTDGALPIAERVARYRERHPDANTATIAGALGVSLDAVTGVREKSGEPTTPLEKNVAGNESDSDTEGETHDSDGTP